ncbi:hypothetical protein Patl1_08259 [Pistacia atlantica]|uniref:Uncharacterized protein n=1 Tax=Pistacia atlantica TaxID=434234 RepID=A0ACC1AIM2_9ROSI|nr:hypothetical protein Patl1_08259 [Pistacia atlantica]
MGYTRTLTHSLTQPSPLLQSPVSTVAASPISRATSPSTAACSVFACVWVGGTSGLVWWFVWGWAPTGDFLNVVDLKGLVQFWFGFISGLLEIEASVFSYLGLH